MRVCWHVFWIGFQGPSDQRRIFSRPEQRKVSELTFKTSIFIWSWSNNTFRGLIGKWFWHQQPQEKNDYEERPSAKREEPYFRVYSKKFQPNFHLIRVWFSRFAVGGNRKRRRSPLRLAASTHPRERGSVWTPWREGGRGRRDWASDGHFHIIMYKHDMTATNTSGGMVVERSLHGDMKVAPMTKLSLMWRHNC